MILMLMMVVEIGVATAIGFILGRIWQIRSDLEQQHAGDFRARLWAILKNSNRVADNAGSVSMVERF